jgi:hypothetical protein
MSEPHDWPYERRGDEHTKPWFLAATGYLFAVFSDAGAAERAERALIVGGVSEADVRLHRAEGILRREAERADESSAITKALTRLTADMDVLNAVHAAATAGGSVLWAYAPTDDDATRVTRLLADHEYVLVRYYGPDGTVSVRPYAG